MLKKAYIRKLRGKNLYRVYSEAGRNMGTYPSLKGAKKRLRDIEAFKRMNKSQDHLFPRGGDGNVPEFFRRNLDYGERDSALKRLRKLKANQKVLQDMGFQKEAIDLKKIVKNIVWLPLLAAVTAATGFAINMSSSAKSLFYQDVAENLDDSALAEYQVSSDEYLTSILHKEFPELNYSDLAYISAYIAEINGISKESLDEKIPAGTKIEIPTRESIEASIKKAIDSTKTIGDAGAFSMPYSDIQLGYDDLKSISEVESFRGLAYDDLNPKTKWKSGISPKGRWTIGNGHLLTVEELKTGKLKIGEDLVDWRGGISEGQSNNLFMQDMARNTSNIQEKFGEYHITPDIKKVVFDIAFLYGDDDARKLLEKSKKGMEIDPALFKENLEAFRLASQPGAIPRRIAEFLTLNNIKIPTLDHPSGTPSLTNILNFYKKYFRGDEGISVKMEAPSKNNIDHIVLARGGFDSSSNREKMTGLLNQIMKREPKTLDEFLSIIDKVK